MRGDVKAVGMNSESEHESESHVDVKNAANAHGSAGRVEKKADEGGNVHVGKGCVHDEDSHNTNNNNNNNNMKDLHDNKEDAHEKAAQTHSDKNKNVKNVHDSKKDDDKKDKKSGEKEQKQVEHTHV
jgi:hypothetical protein